MLVSMALMIGGGLWLYEGLADRMPSGEDIFGKGKTTTTSFETGVSRDIFIDSSAGQHHVRCNVAGPPNMVGDVRIDDYSGSLTVGRWRALFTVTTPQRGLYTITCTGAPSDTFGVGEHDPATPIFGGIGALVGGTFVGGIGLLAILVTFFLRRRRKALR